MTTLYEEKQLKQKELLLIFNVSLYLPSTLCTQNDMPLMIGLYDNSSSFIHAYFNNSKKGRFVKLRARKVFEKFPALYAT